MVTETSAATGLERLQTGTFDCVISDYEMPGQNGLKFLSAVREDRPELPFILFTGKGSEEIASEAISAGVTDYIQKDVGTDQYTILANRVSNAVIRHQAVKQTDLSYRAMETATEGLSLVQPDGTFSYVNPAFANLFEYDPSELIGAHWTILYHNDEATRLENDILPAVRETGYWSGETVRLTKNRERLVTDHRLAHTDEGVIVCTAQDITPERSTEPEKTTGLDILLNALDDHVFYASDHEGYVTRWNEGAERLNGYEAAEILGEHVSTFFTQEDRDNNVPEELIETAKSEGTVTHEGWRVRKDGSRYWADVTISASYTDDETLRGFGQLIRETPSQATP